MLSFLAPKGLRAEVTEGIDLENTVVLSGERVTVGTGPNDSLRLGAADVVPGHLTFERRADGKGWDYFTSDRGVTQVDKGNPRTGTVRAGMWLRLGRETKIELGRADLPPTPVGDTAKDAEAATVPLPVALGVMGATVVVVMFASGGLRGESSGGADLLTTYWVTGEQDLTTALESCLSETVEPARGINANDPSSAFWRVMTHRNSNPQKADAAQADLTVQIHEILATSFFYDAKTKTWMHLRHYVV